VVTNTSSSSQEEGRCRPSFDAGFKFIADNLIRIGNILTSDLPKEYLRMLVSLFFCRKALPGLKIRSFLTTFFLTPIIWREYQGALKTA